MAGNYTQIWPASQTQKRLGRQSECERLKLQGFGSAVAVGFQLNWPKIRRAEVDAVQGLLGSNDLTAGDQCTQ